MTVSNISNSISAPQPIEPAGDTAPVAQAALHPAPVEQITITDPYELTLSVLAFIASTPGSSPDTQPATPVPTTSDSKSVVLDSPKIDLAA